LSTLNSLYDPLGFVASVVIQGKLLLRELISETKDWDGPLPSKHESKLSEWRDSLHYLKDIRIPRTYTTISLENGIRREIHVFSEKAIAAVAYLKVIHFNGKEDIEFLLGKPKVALTHLHTIPRLELCAAALPAEIAEAIFDHLDVFTDLVQFYTDSKVVLRYIHNSSRRFNTYVCNRVDKILKLSKSEQWKDIPSSSNPADFSSRSVSADKMKNNL